MDPAIEYFRMPPDFPRYTEHLPKVLIQQASKLKQATFS